MPRSVALVEAASDRAAVGRQLLGALTGAAFAVGLLFSQYERAAAPVAEPSAVDEGRQRRVIEGDVNGQCHVAARINGSLFQRLLIDSGASGSISFGRNHAAELGFDPARLSFSASYGSANGTGHEAIVKVREFRIESFVLRDVPASITKVPQREPLLGIDILRRLHLRLLKNGNCELSW
jgi:clan AA aspartic protease (TIGR02281 family)